MVRWSAVEDLGDGIWRWTVRHPEWHPGEFGARVVSFALVDGARTLVVDPLVLDDDWERLDGVVAGEVETLITIPYHVRSADAVRARYGGSIWGHPAVARRLRSPRGFRPVTDAGGFPAGVRAFVVGSPRRFEMPLYVESKRALVFGDVVVEDGGRLRAWVQGRLDERRLRWYRERYRPTLEPLLEPDTRRVLVTHGKPVLEDGRRRLEEALAEPWYHRPS
jgi:hypothetical protein